MKTIIPAFLIGLALLACLPAEATSPATECAARQSEVSIKPVTQQELDIEGGKRIYGVFSLYNKSNKSIAIYADAHKPKYWIIHPNSVVLQKKDGNSWMDVVTSLSEYSGPNAKHAVPSNSEWQFLLSLSDLIINGTSQAQEFRLVVMDVSRCNIQSDTFTLESIGKTEPKK